MSALALERAPAAGPAVVWHRESELPEGRPDRHSRRLLLWRLPALRRHGGAFADHARGQGARRARHAGARHLQRLPDPDRGRAAAGRPAAQPDARTSLQAMSHLRVENSQTIFTCGYAAGPGDPRAGRASRRQLLRRSRRRSTGSKARAASPSAIAPRRRRSTTPTTPTARRAASPASSTRAKTVLGLMPHPEDATDPLLGGTDGVRVVRRAGARRWQ